MDWIAARAFCSDVNTGVTRVKILSSEGSTHPFVAEALAEIADLEHWHAGFNAARRAAVPR